MQKQSPKELGDIHLNLFCENHRFDANARKNWFFWIREEAFDFVSVVQSCELIQFGLSKNAIYRHVENRFLWVNQGLFLLKSVLFYIYNNDFYGDVQKYAVESIRRHPLCGRRHPLIPF